MTLDRCSRLNSFIPGFEVAPVTLAAQRYFISNQFLAVHSHHNLKLFGILQLHFV